MKHVVSHSPFVQGKEIVVIVTGEELNGTCGLTFSIYPEEGNNLDHVDGGR